MAGIIFRFFFYLNVLVRSVAGLNKAGTRLDQHHQLSFRVPYLVTNQLIIQPGVAYQRNRGKRAFYYFSLSEGRLVTFYRFQEKRLVQLIAACGTLQFPTLQNRKRQLFLSRSTTSIGRKISLEVNRSTNANSRLPPVPKPG